MSIATTLHALAFPKKEGAALKAAAPLVRNVYRHLYPWAATSKPPAAFRLLHISVHTLPQDGFTVRLLYAACLACTWALAYPAWMKVVTLV